MKKLLLVTLLALAGCTTVPVTTEFPAIPKELITACDPLKTIDEKEPSLSKLMKVVTENYGTHHECAAKVDSFIYWYKSQSLIYDIK